MTAPRLGSLAVLVVLFSAVMIGRGLGSAAPAPVAQRSLMSMQASPVAATPEVADIPQSWECATDEFGFTDLLGLADDFEDESAFGADVTRVSLADLPGGEGVNVDDAQGIIDTTRQLVACYNAQEPLRIASLLTDRFLARIGLDLLAGEGAVTELVEYLPVLQGQVDPDQQLAMIPITAAWYPFPPDKTVYAVLEPEIAGLDEQRSFIVVFSYTDHRWLIDAVALLDDLPQS